VVVGPHIREKIHLASIGREESFALNNQTIGDEGAEAIAEMLKTQRTISKVYLNQCGIGDKGFLALIDAVCVNPTVTDVFVCNNSISPAAIDAAAEALHASRHKNLLQLRTGGDYNSFRLEKQIHDNRDTAKEWALRAQDSTVPLTPDEMREIESRLSAVRDNGNGASKRYETTLGLLPPFPKDGENLKEALFKPAHSGFAPLDNPRLWESAKAQEAAKTLVLDEEFLAAKTPKGSTFLASALHGLPAADFMEMCNKQGITFGAKDLLDGEGEPSPLLKGLAEKPGGIEALFTQQNWQGKRSDMQRVYHAVRDDMKPANYQTLLQQIRPASQQGIGR